MINVILSSIYIGLILGISFATAIKFSANTLTLPVALEIGNVTFNLFNKLEWLMLTSITIASLLTYKIKWPVLACFIILTVQTAYLLPVLNERFMLVSQGIVTNKSFHHTAYIISEVSKVILLFYIINHYNNIFKLRITDAS